MFVRLQKERGISIWGKLQNDIISQAQDVLPNLTHEQNPMNFIDLFTGCGGLSLGLLKAGHHGLLAVEKNEQAFKTLRTNLLAGKAPVKGRYDWLEHSGLEQKAHDITALLSDPELTTHFRKLGSDGAVDLVAGGPPCQGFSTAGKRDPNDPRNKLVFAYLQFVDLVKPKYILMENVRGIAHSFGKGNKDERPVSEEIEKELANQGYVSAHFIEDSSDWGVPQTRKRFVLLAVRKDQFGDMFTEDNAESFEVMIEAGKALAPKLKEGLAEFASHFKRKKGLDQSPSISVEKAITDLKTLYSSGKPRDKVPAKDSSVSGFMQIATPGPVSVTQEYLNLMRDGWEQPLPNGGLRLPRHTETVSSRFSKILTDVDDDHLQKKYQLARRKTLPVKYRDERLNSKKHTLTVLDRDQPSVTVTTLPDDILHYDEPRILTVRELARIQSFPDWYRFEGPYTTGGDRRKSTCPKYTQVGNAVPPLMAEGIGLFLDKPLATIIKAFVASETMPQNAA